MSLMISKGACLFIQVNHFMQPIGFGQKNAEVESKWRIFYCKTIRILLSIQKNNYCSLIRILVFGLSLVGLL